MEHGATAQSEGESLSDDEDVALKAPDSSSSYEVSPASADGRQMVKVDSSVVERRQSSPRTAEKYSLDVPNATSKEFLRPNLHGATLVENLYTDEWIKEDAKRWAATFKGPTDSGNVSQEEIVASSSVHPFRNKSRKRKPEKSATKNCKAKRPKGVYNDSYRQLLNEEIRVFLLPSTGLYNQLPQSQIGVIIWTSAEKESFFTALARLGKDNVRGIATRIGSKSELEVQEYIHLLHQGMVEKISNEPRRQLLGFTDMPSAIQISQECCSELEKAAEALASRQNRYEEQKEQKRWGDSWLLNSDVNFRVEEHLAAEGGSHGLQEVLPAAELLNLRNWLELSTRVFMNPAAPRDEENWHFLAEPGEEPAIRATAFADFHRLATSVTKRLVSTTIFCTMSRLRAMDSKSFNRYDIVKSADVEAAAKIIGLEINSNKFWKECPRRCNLEVMRKISSAAADQLPMDYEEVEEILNKDRKVSQSGAHSNGEASRSALSLAASPSADISSPGSTGLESSSSSELEPENEDLEMNSPVRDLASEYMHGVELEHNGPIDPSDSEFANPHGHKMRMKKNMRDREVLDRAHAEYTEASDLQASLLEEQRLWEILKQEPPFAIKPEEVNLPRRPTQERKDEDEVKDWRDHMQFWSKWEILEQPVSAHAFSRPSRRPRRHQPSSRNAEGDGSNSESSSEQIQDETVQDNDIAIDGDNSEDDLESADED